MFLLFNQIRENGKSHSWFWFEISIIGTKKNENKRILLFCFSFSSVKDLGFENNTLIFSTFFSMPRCGREGYQAGYLRNRSRSCKFVPDQRISALIYQVIMILRKFKILHFLLEIWVIVEKFCNVILYWSRAPKIIDPSAEITSDYLKRPQNVRSKNFSGKRWSHLIKVKATRQIILCIIYSYGVRFQYVLLMINFTCLRWKSFSMYRTIFEYEARLSMSGRAHDKWVLRFSHQWNVCN